MAHAPRWHLAFLSPVDDVYPVDAAYLDPNDEAGRAMNDALKRHRDGKHRTYQQDTKTLEYDVFLTELRAPSLAAWCNDLLAMDDTEDREGYLARTTGTTPWGIPLEPDADMDPKTPLASDDDALGWLGNACAVERYVHRAGPRALVVGETREFDHEWALFTADALQGAKGARVLGSVLGPLVQVLPGGAVQLTQRTVRLSEELPSEFE